MTRYDSSSTSEIINKAEDLVEQLDDICGFDIDAVNLDLSDYNKLHDTVNTNAQKMKLLQEMQKLRMQCASYQRQIITLKQQIKQANTDKHNYMNLKKECISNQHKRAQQRKVISRLYTQINEYRQKDSKLIQKIKELTIANREWLFRYQSVSQTEKIYKRKSLQYQQKLQNLMNGDYDQDDKGRQSNKREQSKIIEVLQSQLKTKDLESTAMKRMLLKYKQLIYDNNKNLNQLTDKIHFLQHQKVPPKPVLYNKTTQTVSKHRNKYGDKLTVPQKENQNPNTMHSHESRHQKRQHLNKWLNTIHNAKVQAPATPIVHGSINDMLHDLKLQILERKLMYT